MTLPVISFDDLDHNTPMAKESCVVVACREGEGFLGDSKRRIWCHTVKQANELVDFYLKTGRLEWLEQCYGIDKGHKDCYRRKTLNMKDITKVYIVKSVRKVRKRPKETGGDIDEKWN